MSLRKDIMKFSVLGLSSDIRIELQALVFKLMHNLKIDSFFYNGNLTVIYLLNSK